MIPTLFLHGFLGCKEDWDPVIQKLPRLRCVALDWTSVDNILEQMDQRGIEKANIVGYSLGGRAAMTLHATHPKRVGRMAILASHPGLKSDEEKSARLKEEQVWTHMLRTEPLATFLEAWYKQPVFGDLVKHPNFPAMLARRMGQDPFVLADMLEAFSLAKQPRFAPSPALFLYGERDLKYAAEYRTLAGFATVKSIPGANHALIVENPDACAAEIDAYLAS
jgi:2-succinyl-6-hydroxy-2,4-cyclohexadiene-1-carboxylate synthase